MICPVSTYNLKWCNSSAKCFVLGVRDGDLAIFSAPSLSSNIVLLIDGVICYNFTILETLFNILMVGMTSLRHDDEAVYSTLVEERAILD